MHSGNGGGMGVVEVRFHPRKQRDRCNIPTKFSVLDSVEIVQYNVLCFRMSISAIEAVSFAIFFNTT